MLVIENIKELITLEPLARAGRCTRLQASDLGRQGPGAWLATDQGKILGSGTGPLPPAFAAAQRVDALQSLVLPGLIDSHTHAIFAGSRANEFAARARGDTYQAIAARGGGILASVRATREASDLELLSSLEQRLDRMLRLGVTTVEVKSGYGLSVPEELRLLRLLAKARASRAQHLKITCLALHAFSPEAPDPKTYVAQTTGELLPTVASEGLAECVDAFVERGYFSVKDIEPFVDRALSLGFKLRLHADEFSDAGGALAAAKWGALAADHLQFASDEGVQAMAEKNVVATILPGTSLYTKIPFTSGRRFADAGVPVALATDFNPGSCQIDHLSLLATVAAVQSGLRLEEVVAAVTFVAAASLGLKQQKGSLAPGYDADFAIWPLPNVEAWLADFGATAPREVWLGGRKLR